jgi:hypothetical protein
MIVAGNRPVPGEIASGLATIATVGWVLGLATLAGCGSDAGSPCAGVDCSGHGTCYTDGLWPLCSCEPGYRPSGAACASEGDGGESGGEDGDTDHGGSCDPGGTDDRCAGGILLRCRTDGTGFVEIPCPFGCAPDGTRCGQLDVPNVTDDDVINTGTADVAIPATTGSFVLLDTDSGSITVHDDTGGVVLSFRLPIVGLDPDSGVYFVTQVQGTDLPDLGLFGMRSLTVPAGVTVVGIGSHGLVLAASGAIRVEGTLSVAGGGAPWRDGPGAGGGAGGGASPPARGTGLGGGRVGRDGGMPAVTSTGGGGAGFGGAGGAGGAVAALIGGPGGAVYGENVIEPLRGGSGGGAGGATAGNAGAGGHGGGALEVVSATSIDVTGAITAGGSGGRGGTTAGALSAGPGGGGGSGGAILLEAPVIRVSGVLAANGGAGGGGAAGTTAGSDGDGAAASATPAQGGVGGLAGANDGAAGSAGSTPDGAVATSCDFAAGCSDTGGGGGGAGRIRINANSTELTGTLSPAADTNLATTGPVRTR